MSAERLMDEHVQLVRRIVYGMAKALPRHVDLDDLVGAGLLGLHQAAATFDPSRGVPFAAYAQQRIRGAVVDSLRTADLASRTFRHRIRAVAHVTDELTVELGRVPTPEEIGTRSGLSQRMVEAAGVDGHQAVVLHLDSVVDDPSYCSALADDAADPAEQLVDAERRALAVDALEALPERLRYVVATTVLADTLYAEVAQTLGVTESRVSQMRSEALELMRGAIDEHLGTGDVAELDDGRRGRRIAAYRRKVAAGARHQRPELRAA